MGRVKDGTLGVLRDGRFRRLAADAPGACARPGARILLAQQNAASHSRPRSVLFGFVDRSIRTIRILDGGRRTAVRIAADGSFLLVTEHRPRGTVVIDGPGPQIRRRLAP